MDVPARRWSELHHGIDPDGVPLLRGWLRLMWALARPLVRLRVPPTFLTILGVVLALDAVLLAASYPWAAALVTVAAAVCDGLDGAVAVVGDQATRGGAIADAMADRVTDAAFAAVLWRCGVPWWLAVVAGVLAWSVDLLRRVRRTPAVITVGERPTWTVCTALACLSATVTDVRWPVLVCAGVWTAAGVLACAQVLRPAPGPSPR
ncbi:MAG: CDP-alcohol phosphatidyltransferase family protein [Jatrophihabitans sp.]